MHTYKSHLVYYKTVVMHGIYRYDTFKVNSCGKTGRTESKQIHDRAICIIQKATHVLASVCVLQNEEIIAYSKACVRSQPRVCVYILQLYSQKFSALSSFAQCLMTPAAFVSIQCITKKEFPGQFHLWFMRVFTCLILFHLSHNLMTNLSQQLQCHCSKQVPPSL